MCHLPWPCGSLDYIHLIAKLFLQNRQQLRKLRSSRRASQFPPCFAVPSVFRSFFRAARLSLRHDLIAAILLAHVELLIRLAKHQIHLL